MAIVRPPITGDYALDSFLDQLTSELSQASFTAANLEQTVLSINNTSYSATLFMYIRTESNEQPAAISSDTVYNYVSGELSLDGVSVNTVDGWSFNTPPSISDGPYYWQCYIHISSETNLENISASSWSTPELMTADLTINGIPVPSKPTNFTTVYTSNDTLNISWVYSANDTAHPGLYAELQQRLNDKVDGDGNPVWKPVAFFTAPSNSIEISGLKGVDVHRHYRVRSGNVLTKLTSAWSAEKKVDPVTPNQVTNVTVGAYNHDTDSETINFEYVSNYASVQLFEIERTYTNDIYERVGTVSSKARTFLVTGVSGNSTAPKYRVRALGLNNKYGPYSTVDANSVGTVVVPATPTSPTFIQNAKNVGSLSWTMSNITDIIHFEIEESVGDENNYTFVSTVQKVPGQLSYSYRRVGLASEDDTIYFRVRAIGLNRSASAYSSTISWVPGVPNAPSSLTYTRLNAEEAKLSWTYTENYSTVRNFVIEVAEAGSDNFQTAASVDGKDRQYIITGMSVRKKTFKYRVRAISLYGETSLTSGVITSAPEATVAPTNLTAQSVINVGTVTAVRLDWTPPVDNNNEYSVITAQLYHESFDDWRDIATVPAESTSVEFQPSRQGVLKFRVRATAVNGNVSGYSNEFQIYIAGGSATDNAIYNGDSAFLATKHYSVNTDDKVLSSASDLEVISGGTYSSSTGKLTGTANTDLVFYWYMNIPSNSVTRSRHYYLNVDNLETVSTNPSPWEIDSGNVIVEVLSSPSDTADFYVNDGTSNDDYIYVGILGETGYGSTPTTDIRTYADRNVGEFMYADREYISLTMKRTFTFRQAGSTILKITLKANPETPVVNLNTGNELRLEAYATELIDDYEDLSVTADATDSDGELWTFTENFEAAPKIFITPNIETTTWVTDKSATSCRIHATDTCTVDLTARGR